MNTLRSIVVAGVLCIANGLYAQQPDSLTIEQAVRLAVQNSIPLRQAEAQRDAAQAKVSQSRSDYYPVVGLSADYTRLGPIGEFSFPAFGSIPLYPSQSINARVAATQTILDLGVRSAKVEANQTLVTASDDNARAIRSAVILQVKRTFYTTMLLERSVRVQDQQIEALSEHLRITERRVESGSATDFDALSTSVRVSQSENVKIDLVQALHDQQIALRRILGLPWDAPAAVTGTFYQPKEDVSLDSLLRDARGTRPDLIAATDAVTSAQAQVAVARGDNDPVLRLHAAYGITNGFEPNIDVLRGNWAAGVSLEVPIYNGSRTRGKVDEAEANVRAAQEHLNDMARNAESEVRQAYGAVQSSRSKIASTDLQVREAESAVANARIRYESGAGTNLDLLDAETNVAKAHLEQLQARYQYMIANVALDAATGAFGK